MAHVLISVDRLKNLFEPKSVALVGQSGSISKVYDLTTTPLLYLLKSKFKGKIYPVNPNYHEICGYKCYSTLSEIPEPIDVALFLVSANKVIPLLEECGQRRVKAVVITSSGFAETGEKGKQDQSIIRSIAEKNGMLVIGPNCNGYVNVIHGIPLTFSPIMERDNLIPGSIGFVSQSGAILSGIGVRAMEQGIGFSYLIGTGNEAHVDLADIINFMVEDRHTQVIMALIEGIKDVKKFLEAAQKALKKKKPIIVLKIGKSDSGIRSALSHTGSLAGSEKVNEAAFKQNGILIAEETDDFIESTKIFTQSILPNGDGIGVVSTSGGMAGLIADLIHKKGLRMGSLSKRSLNDLSKMIRWFAVAKNPFDFAGQFLREESFPRKVFDLFLRDKDIALLIVVMTPLQKHETVIMREARDSGKEFGKPVIFLYLGGKPEYKPTDMLGKGDFPFFTSPTGCVAAIRNLIRYRIFLNRHKPIKRQTISISSSVREAALKILAGAEKRMTEREAKLLLAQYKIPVTREKLAGNVDEAKKISKYLGFPVALKIESPDILHKTEVEGVRLNIRNEKELKIALNEILSKVKLNQPDAEIRGVLIQEMISGGGIESIVGVSRDPQWGPTIMFGLGGVLVEILEDISLRICPITETDAWEMIQGIKGYKLLRGFRGKPEADLKSVVDVLVRVSQLAMDFRQNIAEIDINPLVIFPEGKGGIVVDSSIVLC